MTPRKKGATRVRLEEAVQVRDDPASVLKKGAVAWVAWGAGSLVLAGAAWTAYGALGLPKVATYDYVDDHVRAVVQPLATKVDEQGLSILAGRIEVLKASKQLQLGDKARLDLQARTIKDPVALQIIAGQQKTVDETIRAIDDQVAKLSAQLQAKQ